MSSVFAGRVRKAAFLVVPIGVLSFFWVQHVTQDKPVEVQVASPGYRDIAIEVTTNGVVEPMGEFQARANFPGMVQNVLVELGDKVAPGQVLVTMKDPFAVSRVANAKSVLSSAREASEDMHSGGTQEERMTLAGDLERAKLAESSAQHSLDLLLDLQQQGAASNGEIEEARKKLAENKASVATFEQRSTKRFSASALHTADARLADAKAGLGGANTTFDNANIASPMAGTVYSVSVSPYDFVPMGADLLRVADLDQMQIRAFFDEPEVGKLKAGQEVTISWDARPNLFWHGHIRQTPVGAKPLGNRSVAECLIKVDDARRELLPNTHVLVTVSIERHTHVLSVPRQALQTDGQQHSVFRVIDGKLVRTPVQVGLVNLDSVEIDGGLTAQDVVAVHAMNNQPLTNNLAIMPLK